MRSKLVVVVDRPQRSSAAQEFFHMRASLSQMRASALDFQYRLLRRAIACGATIHSNPCAIWFDATTLSLLFFIYFVIIFLCILNIADETILLHSIFGSQHDVQTRRPCFCITPQTQLYLYYSLQTLKFRCDY